MSILFRYRWIVAVLVLGLGTAGYFIYRENLTSTPLNAEVHWNGISLTPNEVYIRKGGAVTFYNDTDKPFRPISGPHPSHSYYPAFDSKKELAGQTSWTMHFPEAGVFDYHNELMFTRLGRILVIGGPGESIANCLKTVKGDIRPQCWQGDLLTAIHDKGIDAAMEQFEGYYPEPDFQNNCHDVMHYVGKEAFNEYLAHNTLVVRPSTTFCGYGFYHGFMETLVNNYGLSDLSRAEHYCEDVAKTDKLASPSVAYNASQACFHGVGHALFDSLDTNLYGKDKAMTDLTLSQCETLSTSTVRQTSCASGVFNSLANAYNSHTYKISYNEKDPTFICRQVRPDFRTRCYIEVLGGYLNHLHVPLDESLAILRRIEDPEVKKTMFAVFFNGEARHNDRLKDARAIADECKVLRSDEGALCVAGLASGLAQSGKPNEEYKGVIDACGLFTLKSELRYHCFTFARNAFNILYARRRVLEICASLPETEDRDACENFRKDPIMFSF